MSHTRAERLRRAEHQQRARGRNHSMLMGDRADGQYELQLAGGLRGFALWTCYGAIACAIGHFTWPLFRRQTLGLKAFLTSSSGIFGLVIGADDYLLKYEGGVRAAENDMRRQARNALALQGRIATEGEIRKWRDEQQQLAAAEETPPAAQTQSDAEG